MLWVFVGCTLWGLGATPAPSVVQTTLGCIEGRIIPGQLREFIGIPYGESPVGANRFRPTVPKNPWEGCLDATKYGGTCIQSSGPLMNDGLESTTTTNTVTGEEDCLYLNIWTPTSFVGGLPVMFFIHGGSFMGGAGSLYNGSFLASRTEPTVVVTINYRLGALGYLQSEELRQEDPSWPSLGGMNGVVDQVTALKWVVANIASFGGDPGRLTIFGQSAGALSVCFLLTAPSTKGLFQRAILESGSCIGPWGAKEVSVGLENTHAFMEQIGVKTVADLRQVDAHKLARIPSWGKVGPSVDQFFMPDHPRVRFPKGLVSLSEHSSILLGANSQDSLFAPPYFYGPWPSTSTAYKTAIHTAWQTNTSAVLEYYPPGKNESKQWIKINTDACNTCPTSWIATLLGNASITHQGPRVYMYEFVWNPSVRYHNLAGHAAEIGMVFGWKAPHFAWDPDLSSIIMQYWTTFARDGVPKGQVEWPEWDGVQQRYMYLNKPNVVLKGYTRQPCDFMHAVYHDSDTEKEVVAACKIVTTV